MIKSLYIDNFKALNDFSIELHPLTVLIGSNGSGKSTILQAIDLVCSLVKMDLHSYLDQRKWASDDIKSYLSNKRHITFRLALELQVKGEIEEIEWEIILNMLKEKGEVELVKEMISSKTKNKNLLRIDSKGFERYNFEKNEIQHIPPLKFNSSALKTFDIERDEKEFPSLIALKEFALGIDSFDLLSTERMRKNYPGTAESIGIGGEKLAGFIHGLGPGKKKNLKKRLKRYIPFIDDIDTKVNGSFRWIEMSIAEVFKGMSKPMSIKPMHISDGILRMIAISSLAEIEKDTGVILLDEIEDGINPYLAFDLAADLKEISDKKQRQVVVTTHSSVILDYFSPGSIVFLWRNKDGTVGSSSLFENEEMKASLEYMYPGEVWINMSEKEIIEKLRDKK
jgi:predicted ATPase